jgi:beta-lactamase regulating signal transducer with metallopeptidase domain
MSNFDLARNWLAHAAAGGFIVLVLGSLAARLCRQPVRRARVVILTLVTAFAVPWLGALPVVPRWSLVSRPTGIRAPEPVSGEIESLLNPGARATSIADAQEPGAAENVHGAPRDRAKRTTASSPERLATVAWDVVALGAYTILAVGFFAWWLLGQILLRRVARAARPVAGEILEVLHAIAGPKGQKVVVLESGAVDLPFTFTWARPVIVLPRALCAAGDSAGLRFCLAHEWSHIERGDAHAWNLAALTGFVLFYQPLFWWLRRQLRLCQDYLADDRAAALQLAEDYAMYLVQLAKSRRSVLAMQALGIGDRRSNLHRRVAMLVQNHEPLEHRCRPLWSVAVSVSAACVMIVAASFSLIAAPTGQESKLKTAASDSLRQENIARPDAETRQAETLHYTGKVREAGTAKPISGALVIVRRSIPGENNEKTILLETKHSTGEGGDFSFEIAPEHAAQTDLRIEVDVDHRDYVTRAGDFATLSNIRTNQRLGGRPFFEKIELQPGKPITGLVARPDGSPAKGVSIVTYSRAGDREPRDKVELLETVGVFLKTKTDDIGKFTVKIATPGSAVFWILPNDLAGEMHAVPGLRGRDGHVGGFVLKPGVSLKGRILNLDGMPMAGVFVNAELLLEEEARETLRELHVGNAIARTAVTGADGSFTLAPLPPGQYWVSPGTRSRDGSEPQIVRPLRAAFAPQKVWLKEGEPPEPLEIRAVPHVMIEAQWRDGEGKPVRGFPGHVFGRIGADFWFGEATVDPTTEKTVAYVPSGMANARLNVTRPQRAQRWRRAKNEPLSRSRTIDLGTLDHDVKGIEIVQYHAPIVIVKVETKDNKPVPGVKISADYTEEDGEHAEGKIILPGGVRSDVCFKKQDDGRFRSDQLQPDQEFEVFVEADGYKSASRRLTLAEGKIEEITVMLAVDPAP